MGAVTTYLLDTCTFIWLCAESERLSKTAKDAIDTPEAVLLLSDVSILEITLKWSAGKLDLPDPPRHWIENQSTAWALNIQPLDRAVIYRAGELPNHHRDPFDRLLVAMALNLNATILTPDKAIHQYPVSYRW
jgi:PIN domain nuclease of toxin-antitoxin system